MLRTHRLVLAIAALCVVGAPISAQTTVVPMPPLATFLRTAPSDSSTDAVPIALSTLGVLPGQSLHFASVGAIDGGPLGDVYDSLIGVFASSPTLLAKDNLQRVPGAIDAGPDFFTVPTYFSSLATDIDEDFRVAGDEQPEAIVRVPLGATHLFVAVYDSYYEDNSDPNGDHAAQITVVGTFEDVGGALVGSAGAPSLTGVGLMLGNDPWTITLTDARANASTWLVLGFSELDAPFKGGVMVPFADIVLGPLPTGPGGTIALATTWPAGVPSFASVWTQFWIQDPLGPFGFAASNGLRAIAP